MAGLYVDQNGAEHGFVATPQSDAHDKKEPPTLSIASHSVTVPKGGSVALPTITVTPVDSDDTLTVKISGVPSYETITANDGDVVAKNNRSYTFTAAEVESGLTLHSSYTGKKNPVDTLTVDAHNTTAGERGDSASQTITVTDPPAGQSAIGELQSLIQKSPAPTSLLQAQAESMALLSPMPHQPIFGPGMDSAQSHLSDHFFGAALGG